MKLKTQKQKSDNSSLLKVSLDKKDEFDYASASQLASNTTKGLLPFSFVEDKARPGLFYDVTGRATLQTVLKTKLTGGQWRSLLRQIASVLDALHTKGFSNRNLVLDPEFVYVRVDEFIIQFVYLPFTGRAANDRAVITLLDYIARKAVFLLDDDKKIADDFIDFIKLQSVFSLVELKDYLGMETRIAHSVAATSLPTLASARPRKHTGRDFITESTGVQTKEQQFESRSVSENILAGVSGDLLVSPSGEFANDSGVLSGSLLTQTVLEQAAETGSGALLRKSTFVHRTDGRRWVLPLGKTVVGRSRTCDIQIPDSILVSRNHAILVLEDSGCTLIDNGSSNGTWVNNKRMTPHQPVVLVDGDEILLGDEGFTIRIEG